MKKKWRVMFFTETINGKKEQSTKWFFEYHEAETKFYELQLYHPVIIEQGFTPISIPDKLSRIENN